MVFIPVAAPQHYYINGVLQGAAAPIPLPPPPQDPSLPTEPTTSTVVDTVTPVPVAPSSTVPASSVPTPQPPPVPTPGTTSIAPATTAPPTSTSTSSTTTQTFWLHFDSSTISSTVIAKEAPRRHMVVFNAWEAKYIPLFKKYNPKILCFVYKDFSSTRSFDPGPGGETSGALLYSNVNANHPAWFATQAGAQVQWSGFPNTFQMDIGNVGYQNAAVAAVIADLQKNKWDGVFVDNALYSLSQYSMNTLDQYTTDAKFQAAYISLYKNVAPKIIQAGFKFVANMAGIRVTAPPPLWNTYVQYMSGGFDEFWLVTGSPNGELPEYSQGWTVVTNESLALNSGQMCVMQSQSTATDTQGFRYAFASYLMSIGSAKALFSETVNAGNYGAPPRWRKEYTWDFGTPVGAHTTVQTAVYKRLFSKGMALVNANNSGGTVNVPLGGTYLDQDGNSITTASLPQLTGMALRKV